ncbi:hypothetical protein AB4Y45_33155 [Paraburkholderia sp. EG287A]|uniref:hypothetical protein n=1 Tax=Paraburkholderia sp. EG287A TaxID=3237012 RepID=UPI0034D2F43A
MGKIIFGLCCSPLITALNGWVAACMWLWFAVPFGAPAIGVWGALGLSCLVSAFWGDTPAEEGSFFAVLIARILQPLLVLLVGFVVHECWLHVGYMPPHLL